ncbi:UDP-N-acetylmuramoyl-L-alanine--D-glutamate ligase [Bacillus sp. FSL W7-1360]
MRKNQDKLKEKKILVLGMAKSGAACATLLVQLGAIVTINDAKERMDHPEASDLEALGVKVVCGGHPLSLLDDIDVVIKNPGIRYDNVLVKAALEKGLPVWTEIELTTMLSEADVIAITGSNGKTTTTTLVNDMLKDSGRTPRMAGNIGIVASTVAANATKQDILVLELSSFQLMGTDAFKPKIAVWLNLFDAHLDYHGSRDAYIAAKAKIAANLTAEDYLVYNADDTQVVKEVSRLGGTKVPFSRKEQQEAGAYLHEGMIMFRGEQVMPLAEVVLPGEHNTENMLAAVAAAKLAGATSAQIYRVLTSFSGVKHRLQFVGTWEGRSFYNDAKATNVLATQAALSSFTKPTILLAGGLDRGHSFEELRSSMAHVKAVIAFGETRKRLASFAEKAGSTAVVVNNIGEAVREALKYSNEGDVILLSPACASWDQYRTFEERGDAFLQAVAMETMPHFKPPNADV